MAQFDSSGQLYTVASEPKTVAARRKYRDPYEQSGRKTGNLMWDPRVYRGSAFAAQVVPPSVQEEMAKREKAATTQRRRQERAQLAKMQKEAEQRIGTPEPVEGRKHMDVQTDAFLEEILERPIEKDMETQTDPLLDRPPSPLFVPQKSGVDADTQIFEGELFDFDVEVDPLLEVIVGKTLEQSMMEVLQEQELEAMIRAQKEHAQKRNAELADTQRLEAAERRRFEEKERRKQQERDRVAREAKAKAKLDARTFAQGYLQGLHESVMAQLDRRGYLFDTVEREVEQRFIPWLFQRAEANLQRKRDAQAVVDAMIAGAVTEMTQRGDDARELRERRAHEEAERRRREEEDRLRKIEEERRRKEEEEERKRQEAEERARLEAEQAAEDGEGADGDQSADEDDA